MSPPILALRDIALTFGVTPLLTGAELVVHQHDRICLVGRNGSGKSTLLKIAAGELEQDDGDRFIQPGTTVYYLPQEIEADPTQRVMDYAAQGFERADDLHRISVLLAELGLTGEEDIRQLSGGELRRAGLARALANQPDILLLDEPTNHLDLPAIEWLESKIKAMRCALVVISHDRRFLQNISRSTVWIDRGKSRLLEQNFSEFEDWRDEVLAQEQLDAHKLDRKIVREEHWVTHGVSGRRKRNMRRLGELANLRRERAERINTPQNVQMSVSTADSSGKLVIKAEHLSKSYGARVLVKDFSLRVARGERIGIVGSNGVGKTTLVNLIIGRLDPDAGTLKIGSNVDMLVLDQKRAQLDMLQTVKETLTGGGTDLVTIGSSTKHVMAYMKDFLFLPEQANTAVEALSGGERGRLVLAKNLRHPSNMLILDEPTNDLDLETLDLLQETISDYDGTVIVISHDRDFLDRICSSVIAPGEPGEWTEYAGVYSDMLQQRGRASLGAFESSVSVQPKKNQKAPATGELAVPKPARSKLSFKDKHALDTLPGLVEQLQDRISKLNDALANPDLFAKDRARFDRHMADLANAQSELTAHEDRWLEIEMKLEELES